MVKRAEVRSWLGAAVAAAALGGLVFVSTPAQDTAPVPATGPGQPLGAVGPESTADPGDASRADSVGELLDRRAAAILARDETAFLATIDPKAEPHFVTRQRELFTNLAGVPLDEWSYRVHPDDDLDLAELPAESAGAAADELWAPGIDLRYALTGADLAPTDRPMGYLFARAGGTWYLRSDTALDGLGRRTWRGPWDFAPCVVTSTKNGVVLSHPGSEPMVERLVREVGPSIRAVAQVWPAEWSERVALVLPDTPAEMRALVGPDFPVDSVVAVAVADRVDNAAHTAVGQRVVLSPMGIRSLSTSSLRVVLRHEITHVAARAHTVDGSPTWLLEGFADYVGYRDSKISLADGAPSLAKQVRRAGPPDALPEDRAFRGSGAELDQAYQQSWSIARFIADRYGEETLVATYRRLAAAGPVSASETDAMLREVLGVDRAGLVDGWRGYLADELK